MKKITIPLLLIVFSIPIVFLGIRYAIRQSKLSKKQQPYTALPALQNKKSSFPYVSEKEGLFSKSLTKEEFHNLYKVMNKTAAIQFLKTKIKAHPEDATLYYKAYSFLPANDRKTKLKYMNKAVALQPNQLLFLDNLGTALMLNQKYEEAIQVYEKAKILSADPRHIVEDMTYTPEHYDEEIKSLKSSIKQKKTNDKKLAKLYEEGLQDYEYAKKFSKESPSFRSEFRKLYPEKKVKKWKRFIQEHKMNQKKTSDF